MVKKLKWDGSAHRSTHGSLKQRGQDFLRRKMFFGQLARGAAVLLVAGLDVSYAAQDFRHVLKSDDALAHRQPITQPGVLNQQRQTRGEITNTAIAEPPGTHFHVTL